LRFKISHIVARTCIAIFVYTYRIYTGVSWL